MIYFIEDKLVHSEVLDRQFMCNLQACKGACCWEGDSGAPLLDEERSTLDAIYPEVAPYLTEAGREAISESGTSVWYHEAEEYGTTLVNNGPCAFMAYTSGGIATCGIEQAYRDGKIDYQKPISCHLYPIRVERQPEADFEALNYDRWEICSAACELGQKNQLPVFRFVREALLRAYGPTFYQALEDAYRDRHDTAI